MRERSFHLQLLKAHRYLNSFAQYGQDTGNPAATFHEVRVWKEEHEPEGKPLIPLRMVGHGFRELRTHSF